MLRTIVVLPLLLLAFFTAAQTPPIPATLAANADIQAFINALPREIASDKPICPVGYAGDITSACTEYSGPRRFRKKRTSTKRK